MTAPNSTTSLLSSLQYEPQELQFGTSGRRGKVVDLTQLEVYINAFAELEYLQSLSPSEGGIVRGEEFFFATDLRPVPPASSPKSRDAVKSPRLSSPPSRTQA